MRFAVCSLATGEEYKRSVVLCTLSQVRHAKTHGYTRITEDLPFDAVRRELQWAKVPLLQKHLADWDWLVWLDGDVLITNQERKIDDLVELVQPGKFLFVGKDFQGLNSGVFFIKNCPLAHDFLADVWAFQGYDRALFHEQTAMDNLIQTPKYNAGVQVVPHEFINIMNAYDYRMDPKVHWLPGDFCVHFAGVRGEGRDHLQNLYTKFSSTDPASLARVKAYVEFLKQNGDCSHS
jgi:hypothetical protein